MVKKVNLDDQVHGLKNIELKLKGMAYLIESQNFDECPLQEEEIINIHRGIGLILQELSSNLTIIRNNLEAIEMRKKTY